MSLPQVRIEVGFTSPYVGNFFVIGDPVRGRVGVTPIGAEDIWSEIPLEYVRSWQVRRGANHGNAPTRRYEPGTATIVFHDPDRRFDPDNLTGPYVSGGVSQLTPMRRVRITAVYNGIAYPIYTGYADDWQPDYQGNTWTYTTLTATDATKVFADRERPAISLGGTGELTGARIGRILNSAGWPAEDRILAAGEVSVQGTNLAGNALTELQLTQDTDLGELFVDASGRVVFQDRGAVTTSPRAITSQATFGDGGYASTGELPYADVKVTGLDETLINQVRVTRVGGVEQLTQDAASQAAYLTKTHERSDLIMQTDAEAAEWANALLYQHKDPVRRFARMEFNTPALGDEDALWPQLLGREFGDRITVIRRPAGGGTPIQHDAFIRGVEHQSDGAAWTSAFVLQSTEQYSFITVGHPDLGRVGVYPVGF